MTKNAKKIIMDLKYLQKSIIIWKFEDAPERYQKLSENGGDEDFIALIYKNLWTEYKDDETGNLRYDIPFFIDSESFGCCEREFHKLNKYYLIVIGSHS